MTFLLVSKGKTVKLLLPTVTMNVSLLFLVSEGKTVKLVLP